KLRRVLFRSGIERIHLEEDAGKLTHSSEGSLVDYNRQGTPLIEIVSEADIRSPEEAYAYLEKLKSIIQYTGVSDVRMEEGSLRADANISIRPVGEETCGTKTEEKNLNSCALVRDGIAEEATRQAKVHDANEEVVQSSGRYDEKSKKSVSIRVKGDADDYRFFPDPDIPPLH